MKISLNILKETIKKIYPWLIIFFFLYSFTLILNYVDPMIDKDYEREFLSLLGYKTFFKESFVSIILNLYQIFLLIYFIYTFYTFELNNSLENFLLRVKSKKWLFFKIVVLFLSITLFKTIYFLTLYPIYKDSTIILWSHYFIPLFDFILISIMSISIININRNKNMILELVLIIILSYMILFIEIKIKIKIILFVILIILNLLFFKFKKLVN